MTPPDLPQRVLALDTSTDRLSVAVGHPGAAPLAEHSGPGGAQASASLIPVIQDLLARVGWRLDQLDAIAYGCGPGSFTGLRTACAVVQGLAVAGRPGGIPVLPVPTLLAVAQAARADAPPLRPGQRVLAVLDARMDELYVAEAVWSAAEHRVTPPPYRPGAPGGGATEAAPPTVGLRLCGPAWLSRPEDLATPAGWPQAAVHPDAVPPAWWAGNAHAVYSARLPAAWQAVPRVDTWPTAAALLALVPGLWAAGAAVDAAQAQPLYVRDKVAHTTEERERLKAAQVQARTGDAA
ncbi:tRNA (adenosine(37)-N6)-threonylcarbamoyltransferase complex dimerization subunit type 1 TsaB [Aquabacterium sp. A08]|uniref:tRNA (adenosine(37)-N6)-threonylcarbamoyltransferase complex dimerization subunit type 1 TsaB n=1 Tax=Aquabacterium sp. A08 TaxID=2718532 RepID=UPI0014237E81|nr:tRNA (adenosine(37)-N6)-threonylcarbamoyltransferase complex dimerization subunit type 1 TsaB [Aquabacterium sp. A08]NIC41566.1 tRNA (adenosine(37)-N6)-threonylcarbamoyltransferase complex dimerization subunit type 1 TsaB [Aquabacterium sp. A08]